MGTVVLRYTATPTEVVSPTGRRSPGRIITCPFCSASVTALDSTIHRNGKNCACGAKLVRGGQAVQMTADPAPPAGPDPITDDQIRQLLRTSGPSEHAYATLRRALDGRQTEPNRREARRFAADLWTTLGVTYKVFADSITDDQIRESGARSWDVERALATADRNWTRAQRLYRQVARERCAAAWNARHTKESDRE